MAVHESDYIQTPCACGCYRIAHDDVPGYSRGVKLGRCDRHDNCLRYEVVRTIPDPSIERFKQLLESYVRDHTQKGGMHEHVHSDRDVR